jgi:hypothetical protein
VFYEWSEHGKMQKVEQDGRLYGPILQSDEGFSIEEDLRTINSMAPELLSELPRLFKNAVVDSIRSEMGRKDFGLILKSLPGIGPEHRPYVFRFLDSLYGDKARDLEDAIDRRFHTEVRQLLRNARRIETATLKIIDPSIRSR